MIPISIRFLGRMLVVVAAALALSVGAAGVRPVAAQPGFPRIPLWSYPGAYQQAAADTVREQARTTTLRWLRDPRAEARPDFGGYRIYRVFNDTTESRMQLVRRFSVNSRDSVFMWHFPRIDTLTPLPQRVATFIDPDSSGSFFKRCRKVDEFGRCISRGDSIIVLLPPPGPHDGFRTWYSITYEARNSIENEYADLFVADTISCSNPDRARCPNLNGKKANLTSVPVEPTSGPTTNLERVYVVPNPYRATEAWDQTGGNEIHFINLPPQAKITIYTVAGDLITELVHNDNVRDFERWDLRNGRGDQVSSGIYMYRIESGSLFYQSRFVVIR